MEEPETTIVIEAPGGLIEAKAQCRNGKAERISVRDVPSFADQLNVTIELKGRGSIKVDTAYGGDSLVFVDAKTLGFELTPDEARDIAELGVQITKVADEQIGSKHPLGHWNHISFCQFVHPVKKINGGLQGKNAVAIRPGKIDRSPCGTVCSARMAILHARGQLNLGDLFISHSLIDTEFKCQIDELTSIESKSGIIPRISGRAWITGTHQHILEPTDPFP